MAKGSLEVNQRGAYILSCPKKRRIALGIISGALAVTAVILYINGTAIHKTLIPNKPWGVQYGDILDDGKDRIYVHALFNNEANATVTFQVYGKALVEPPSLTRIQREKISDKLKDDVRMFASGDDAPILTANPRDDQDPTPFDIPGPVGKEKDLEDWRKGKSLVYYAVLVYVKESNEMRFAIHDCEITRAVTKQASAGEIPRLGMVWVNYGSSEETACDDTGKQ